MGRIVWWGDGASLADTHLSKATNGVLEIDKEMAGNFIAIAARRGNGLAVRQDGRVFTFGINWLWLDNVPTGLSNVVSGAAENDNSFWAIKRDGTVAVWGYNLVSTNQAAGLSNIVAVALAGYGNYLAIKNDGTVLGLRFNGSQADIQPVKVAGHTLSDVVAAASMGNNPLVVKKDGSVWSLEDAISFGQYATADPFKVDGVVLSNVVALAVGDGQELALKRNGTVIA
jgi:alpha-tubulin suppressor-like RCC1 family protein